MICDGLPKNTAHVLRVGSQRHTVPRTALSVSTSQVSQPQIGILQETSQPAEQLFGGTGDDARLPPPEPAADRLPFLDGELIVEDEVVGNGSCSVVLR